MKPVFVPITVMPGESFAVCEVRTPGGSTLLNYHAGWQITLIVNGRGQRFIGDHVGTYRRGDLVMIGPFLPHMWRDELGPAHHGIVVNFADDFLGEEFLRRPEVDPLRDLFQRARRGLRFTGSTAREGAALMREMNAATGLQRLIALLRLLELFTRTREVTPLASMHYASGFDAGEEDRLSIVFRHLNTNLHRDIARPEVARLIGLSEGAFSRFFTARVGLTFPAYLNELRTGRACRLLMETNQSVNEIATACGYHHTSHFNREFLARKTMTPSAWRAQLRATRQG